MKGFLAFVSVSFSLFTFAATELVDGVWWFYTVTNGEVSVGENGMYVDGAIIIPEKLGGYPVTSIALGAFENCSSLTSVVIPESVTSIGHRAFYGCSSLTSVSLPEGLSSIESSAFSGCSSLTSVSLPEGLSSIESSVFRDCSSLTSVVFPDGLTSIGVSAFSGCSALASVSFPEELTSIRNFAFNGCSSLTSVSLPEGLTSIGEDAFRDCSSLTSVSFSEGLTSIGDSAFYGCSSLASVSFPEGLTSIGDSAFNGCSSLTSVSFSEGLTSIGGHAFEGCSSLASVSFSEGLTSIGDSAFRYCSSLTSISFPEGLTSIGNSAFSGCSSLTSVVFPDGLTSIGEYAFSSCRYLREVSFPSGLRSIGANAFYGCKSLSSALLQEGLERIGAEAFRSCSSLTSVEIPSTVTWIGADAFYGCPISNYLIFDGEIPNGLAESGLLDKCILFSQEHAGVWETLLPEGDRLTILELLSRPHVKVTAKMLTQTTMEVTYTIKSETPEMKVRAVAFKDGKRDFANIIPIRTGENIPNGGIVKCNEPHTFTWEVDEDWAGEAAILAVEILTQEGSLLPQEQIVIPATTSHGGMTITRNALIDPWLFDALVWCYAERDDALLVVDGVVSVGGVKIADGTKLVSSEPGATALLNYLYGKMGYKVLSGEDLEYAEYATQIEFATSGLRQVSVKIEERN